MRQRRVICTLPELEELPPEVPMYHMPQPFTVIMDNSRDLMRRLTSGLRNWGRRKSLWPLTFGIACCAIEMMDFGASRTDSDRHGVFFRASPRQADVMILAGWISAKLAPRVKQLYEQMPHPKYVICMGECTISGGMFYQCYNIVNGGNLIVPVDVYIPGCPPRPEALMQAFLVLQEKIKKEGEYGKGNPQGKTP